MKGDIMKKIFIALEALLTLTGCSTVTHYDAQGNVIKVERVTNFSRVMDGTNAKSQMMLVNGTFVGFEASATAGDNCTPGISVKYADGKVAVVNALTGSNFSGVGTVVEKFLAGETSVGVDGVSKK